MIESGMLIDDSAVQLENAPFSMDVTESGIVIDFSASNLKKKCDKLK